jgi:SAM-dependent methyltransferase
MRAVDHGSYDELYRSAPAVWSGRPNRQLVVEGGVLSPGTALDAGCGEGADALWLAERGWRVTGVDFSAVALDRAAAHARARGLDDRITWLREDLDVWTPAAGGFDLVTAHYLHSHGPDRPALFARLAGAVAPGGTLLVVGHLLGEGAGDPQHHQGSHADDGRPGPHGHDPDLLYTAEDVAAALEPGQWGDVVAETRDRDPAAATRTGNPAPDTVLVARRRTGVR